jgi:hypothetical protein
LLELIGDGVDSGSMEGILAEPMSEEETLDAFARMKAMLNG